MMEFLPNDEQMPPPDDETRPFAQRCKFCTHFNAGWCSVLHQWQRSEDYCEDWIAAEADDDDDDDDDD